MEDFEGGPGESGMRFSGSREVIRSDLLGMTPFLSMLEFRISNVVSWPVTARIFSTWFLAYPPFSTLGLVRCEWSPLP